MNKIKAIVPSNDCNINPLETQPKNDQNIKNNLSK